MRFAQAVIGTITAAMTKKTDVFLRYPCSPRVTLQTARAKLLSGKDLKKNFNVSYYWHDEDLD